jgi:peptidoglycan/xylan/chitin deacetylase (PgdA/CDA1 family)
MVRRGLLGSFSAICRARVVFLVCFPFCFAALAAQVPASPASEVFDAPDAIDFSIDLSPSPQPQEPAPTISTRLLRNRAILLCWHTFLGQASISTDFSLEDFAAQLDSYKALGYRFIDLADLLAGKIEGPLNIVATLDDGHWTIPHAIEKVFLPRGIHPAVFVYPAIVGSVSYAVDDAAMKRIVEEGCLVGAHGYHHLYVNEELYRNEPAEFNKEIFKAKEKTEALTGLPVVVYAYPYGAYSPITIKELARAGYAYGIGAYGIGVRPGFVYADPEFNLDYELPRLVVTKENWKDIYALLRRNALNEYGPKE